MQISRLTADCLQIKDKKINILLGKLADKLPSVEAQIIVAPHEISAESLIKIKGNPFMIKHPGEYEISDITISNVLQMYIIEGDGIRVGYLSNPEALFADNQIEEIDGLDVLTFVLSEEVKQAAAMAKTTNQIQPKLVIPLGIPASVKQFLKEIGQEEPKIEKKLNLIKTALPEETTAVVLQ